MTKRWLQHLLLMVGGIYCLYAGYQYTYPLYTAISHPPAPKYISIAAVLVQSDDLISAGMELVTMLTLGLFLILMLIPRLADIKQSASPRQQNGVTVTLVLGLLMTMMTITGTLLYVDPRGYYETGHYSPRISQSRKIKLEVYANYPQQPELVILGSSHAELADAYQITELSGLDTFNASIEGGSPIFTGLIVKYIYSQGDDSLPPVLMIEVRLSLETSLEPKYAPNRLIPYMDYNNILLTIEERSTALFNLQHLSEALYVYFSQTEYGSPPPQTYLANGTNPFNAEYPPEVLEEHIDLNIHTYHLGNCPNNRLDPHGQATIDEIVQMANENNTAIIFYQTPVHPRYYETRIANHARLEKCKEIFDTYFETLSTDYPNIFYLDYLRVASFNGLTDNQGWLDGHHMTKKNNTLLFKAALPTIQEAYAWTQEARAK